MMSSSILTPPVPASQDHYLPSIKVSLSLSLTSELVDPVGHEEPAELRVSQGTVDEEVDKVAAGLDGEDHVGLQSPRGSQ